MSSKEKEVLAKEFQKKGMSQEEALKEVNRIFTEEPSVMESIRGELGLTTDFFKEYGKVADKLDPAQRTVLGVLGAQSLSKIGAQKDDGFDKDMEKMFQQFRRLQMLQIMSQRFSNNPSGPIEEWLRTWKEESGKQTKILEDIKKHETDKEQNKMLDKLDEISKKINPGEAGQTISTGTPTTPLDVMKQAKEYITTFKGMLEQMGYDVSAKTISRENLGDELGKLDAEKLSSVLEQRGYKITGKPIPFSQYEEDLKRVRDEGMREGQGDKSVEQTAKSIENIFQSFFENVLGPAVAKGLNMPISEPVAQTQTSEVQAGEVQSQNSSRESLPRE